MGIIVAIGLIQYSCANEMAPTGGKEDADPPVLKEASPPNKSTRFTGKKIHLTFNEFIQNGSFARVIISPPIKERPAYTMSGKTLNIRFKEELRPNTTYTINFGDEIKDYNKGNVAPNFTYVFSTGDYIDSQKVSGRVVLAKEGTATENIMVALYDKDSTDAILYAQPMYFAKTDKGGSYQIENVKADQYKIFALKDENFNYIYDQPNELIGFTDTLVDLTDSVPAKADFIVFKEEGKRASLQNVNSIQAGNIQLAYTGPVRSLKISSTVFGDSLLLVTKNAAKDTINLWYSKYYVKFDTAIIVANDTIIDTATIELKFIEKDSALLPNKFNLSIVNQSVEIGGQEKIKTNANVQSLYGALKIKLSRPILEINEGRSLQIFEDSMLLTVKPSFKIDITRQILEVDFPRKEKASYSLVIPDSTLKDVFGWWNKRMVWSFTTNEKDAYGNIHLKLKTENTLKYYIVQLMNANNEIIKTIDFTGDKERKIELQNLPAGAYHIAAIEDTNRNGEWDTGNLRLKKQPEKIINVKDTYTLKGGWDLDVEVIF